MTIGTKSVLYGAHCFFIHPWFVAAAWWKLYGFPWDFKLWLAFFLHDLGYWGKPNMDGPEGEEHPRWAAIVMFTLFGHEWWEFCMYHSRFWAKRNHHPVSKLCYADKLSITLEPRWFYLMRVNWSGEIKEYMAAAKNDDGKYITMNISTNNQHAWHADVCNYLRRWVQEHKDGREDTWTPEQKEAK